MDDLSLLFFEDSEDDGITGVSINPCEHDPVIKNGEHAINVGEDEVNGAVCADGASGVICADGGNDITFYDFIQAKNCSPKKLKSELSSNCKTWMEQVNQVDKKTGLAPIHHIVMNAEENPKCVELLLTLLTYGNADINARASNGKTALMLAIELKEQDLKTELVKTLVAIGADVSIAENDDFTDSTDGGHNPASEDDNMVQLLKSVGASDHFDGSVSDCNVQDRWEIDRDELAKKYYDLNNKWREYSKTSKPDVACECVKVLNEAEILRTTKGSRILCLDGGGVRGLVQIEMLRQIEQKTGRKIVDLFDWIVGTSSGAIIALALVYGGQILKSPTSLQRLYFRLTRDVFSCSGYFKRGNSKQLNSYLNKIFKGKMNEKLHPKVLVPAVKQDDRGLKLTFFNNCFGNEFSKVEVWKAARYSSAAPLYFTSEDGYLDGGLLCNNPTEDALTVIQQFYRERKMQLPISLIVSLGSGINSVAPCKQADITTDMWKVPARIFPFMKTIEQALMNPQTDVNCSSRCIEQGIHYVRLNPQLDITVDCGETDNKKLIKMLWSTRQYLKCKLRAVLDHLRK